MNQWTDADWNELLAEVGRRAAVDPDFRELAIKNGTAALKAVASGPIPTGMSLTCVDNSVSNKTLVLPAFVSGIEELTDFDLERVAGGDMSITWRR